MPLLKIFKKKHSILLRNQERKGGKKIYIYISLSVGSFFGLFLLSKILS